MPSWMLGDGPLVLSHGPCKGNDDFADLQDVTKPQPRKYGQVDFHRASKRGQDGASLRLNSTSPYSGLEAARQELRAMGFGRQRRIEHLARLFVQELRVLGVDHEPTQLRRKRLDQAYVVDESSQERFARHAVVPREGGVGDEVAAFEALLQSALVSVGRAVRAGRNDEEQQGRPRAHGVS